MNAAFVITAPQAVAQRLCSIFDKAQLAPQAVYEGGGEAAEAAQGALVVTTWKLDDMTGLELAERLGEDADVLMIVPADYEQQTDLPQNVLLLRNPVSPDALVQSVLVMAHCRERMGALRARAQKLSRTLEERKLIDRAKGRLMDGLHMTEAEAHHFIQKRSMDLGQRIAEVAGAILAAEDLSAL
ncbi:MAG: ANTAR domain-containing protein [Clostridia bacterium]|nr:ANTAR domain-containing protein [Clostridia bacterium]